MIYLITEDITSGRDFWLIFFNKFYPDLYKLIELKGKDENGKTIRLSGNRHLAIQVDLALEKSQENDVIFIALDNIGNTKNFDSESFVTNTIEKCRMNNVHLYITTYYCFEEIYLSYPELLRLNTADGKDLKLLPTIKFVLTSLKNNENYFVENADTEELFSIIEDARVNREHMADALLKHSTKNIKNGYFEIAKKKNNGLKKCWLNDCSVMQKKQTKQIDYFCKNCKYCMANKKSDDKMKDLLTNSFLTNDFENDDYITAFAEKFI